VKGGRNKISKFVGTPNLNSLQEGERRKERKEEKENTHKGQAQEDWLMTPSLSFNCLQRFLTSYLLNLL
jgi:hypothetical protein